MVVTAGLGDYGSPCGGVGVADARSSGHHDAVDDGVSVDIVNSEGSQSVGADVDNGHVIGSVGGDAGVVIGVGNGAGTMGGSSSDSRRRGRSSRVADGLFLGGSGTRSSGSGSGNNVDVRGCIIFDDNGGDAVMHSIGGCRRSNRSSSDVGRIAHGAGRGGAESATGIRRYACTTLNVV